MARTVTPLGAFVVLASAVMTLTTGFLYALGQLVRRLQPLDWATYHAIAAHRSDGLVSVMAVVTQLGNKYECWIVSAVAAVSYALLARRRRWAGLVVVGAGVVLQHYQQVALSVMVHRGHPPGSGGTFPSGGSARVIAVYGLCVLVLLCAARLGRGWWLTGGIVVAVLAVVEGVTRLLLNAHWLTDVLSGWLSGVILLAGLAYAAGPLLAATESDASRPESPRV